MQADPEVQWARVQASLSNNELDAAAEVCEQMLRDQQRPVAALLTLATIAQRRGQFRAEVEATRRAADEVLLKKRWEVLATVAMRLLVLGEYARVVVLIEGADWSDRNVLNHAAGLVQYLGLADRHESALIRIEAAMRRMPPHASLHYAHAIVLRHLGRVDEARDALERCIALAPRYAQAHWTLAFLQRNDHPGARIARIEQAAAELTDDAADLPLLDYALFREFEDAGRYEEAWTALARGAQRKRLSLRQSSEREDQMYADLQRVFTADLLSKRSGAQGSIRPIFIVGLPRSGTTLLERVLGNHPDVASGGELNDFSMQLCWEADRHIEGPIDQRLIDQAGRLDYTHLGQGYLERTAWRARGGRFLVDKNPINFLNIGFILKALPDARVLCLHRDPMDSCFSNFKELFSGNNYAYSYTLPELAAQFRRFDRLMRHWQNAASERVMRVDYESLVSNPEVQARRILSFCGLPWDPHCVDIASNTSPSATASSVQVREGIHARNIAAWRRYAEPLQPLQALLESYGYPASRDPGPTRSPAA